MTVALSSNALGLENPLRFLGRARITTAVVSMIIIGVAFVIAISLQDAVRQIAIVRCVIGLVFALNLLGSGLRDVLAIMPMGDVPGSLRQGGNGAIGLLEKKVISGTYDQPKSLIGLMIYRITPRFAFLTPSHRTALAGIEMRVVWLIASLVAGAMIHGAAFCLSLVLAIELAARWGAVFVASSEQPSTTGVREKQNHLGDKGNPVGLFHHLRLVCESFRVGEFPNRRLSETVPHIAEHVQDARIAGEYFVETQPQPIRTSSLDGILLAGAGVLVGVLGVTLLLVTPLMTPLSPGSWYAVGAGILAMSAAFSCFRLAFTCLAAMRFKSDLFLLRLRGTYNTTRVGSQHQRVSFQSDIYFDILSARIVSEVVPGGHQGTGTRIEDVLQSPRIIVTVVNDEILDSRLSQLKHFADTYHDQASEARSTNLSSEEYTQHLLKLHAEALVTSQASVQGSLIAHGVQSAAQPPVLPVATPPRLPSTRPPSVPLPASQAGTPLPRLPLAGAPAPPPVPLKKKPIPPPPKKKP